MVVTSGLQSRPPCLRDPSASLVSYGQGHPSAATLAQTHTEHSSLDAHMGLDLPGSPKPIRGSSEPYCLSVGASQGAPLSSHSLKAETWRPLPTIIPDVPFALPSPSITGSTALPVQYLRSDCGSPPPVPSLMPGSLCLLQIFLLSLCPQSYPSSAFFPQPYKWD